ncbi:nucleoside deaminase [Aciduricibacillus chroicocephali]|uniref:Nucleoside deaminase n=1 Tax=Aciduricibacillus chroicocephali TaxID=3054939 RepID=A0ABY9KW29_9BACI|nr:nucleoside deaminase [Bacillaceae bacterium 44XB]
MNQFMKRALELAALNARDGGQPYGAVIVKENKIVAEGVNTLHKIYDISGHAELLAMRKLQEEIQTNDLSAYTMYASGEPCKMCQSAMYLAGLRDIYYSQSMEDALDHGFPEEDCLTYDKLRELAAHMKRIPLEEGQEDPMVVWENI